MKGSAITGPIGTECVDLWPRIASAANAIGIDRIRKRFNLLWIKGLLFGKNTAFITVFLFLKDELGGNDIDLASTSHQELDAELESLRKKLVEVGKELEMLNQEIQAFPKQLLSMLCISMRRFNYLSKTLSCFRLI